MSLIADVRRITTEYMGKIAAQQQLLQDHERNRENFSEARFTEIERQLGMDMDVIKAECERKVRERVEQYKADISAADALNGSKLTDDAKLLKGDYPLTVNDLNAMLARSAGNRTMEKLIHDYAREHSMSLNRAFYPRFRPGSANESASCGLRWSVLSLCRQGSVPGSSMDSAA